MYVSASSYLQQMFTHRGFNITEDNYHWKKTVDDFMDSIEPTKTPDDCKRIDAARIAAARASACIMLLPLVINSKQQQLQNLKKMKATGSTAVVFMFVPNRIQLKHLTSSSRVRNLTHGGILGVLTRRLNRDPTQQKQWHQFNGALCVVQRANSTDGCAHVKWSIPEFQCAFNIGVKRHSTVQNHINEMAPDALIAHFNLLNTAENRNTFLAECSAVAHHHANQSRFVVPMDRNASAMLDWTAKRPVVLENTWIMDFMVTFAKLCSAKMDAVNNPDASTLERCMRLVDLYRFIVQTEWMVNDPNVRCVLYLNGFYAAHIKKLMHMATEGIEHSAYMLGILCPEMMTPELHLRVVANPRFYRIPQMLISDDDEVFGPMKVACQGFMPLMADPLPVRRQLYPDSDNEYNDDYTDDSDYDSNDYRDDDSDDDNNDVNG
jgi:hypothetical protein